MIDFEWSTMKLGKIIDQWFSNTDDVTNYFPSPDKHLKFSFLVLATQVTPFLQK